MLEPLQSLRRLREQDSNLYNHINSVMAFRISRSQSIAPSARLELAMSRPKREVMSISPRGQRATGGDRTRDFVLGKNAHYRLCYSCKVRREGIEPPITVYQTVVLPTELPPCKVVSLGLEPRFQRPERCVLPITLQDSKCRWRDSNPQPRSLNPIPLPIRVQRQSAIGGTQTLIP